MTALIAGIAGGAGEGKGWWIAFGTLSVIAGIVVTATPVTVLAVLLGAWFIVIGIFEIIGGIMLRRADHRGRYPRPAGRPRREHGLTTWRRALPAKPSRGRGRAAGRG